MAAKPAIELRICGGINNNNIGIDVFISKKGETQSCINADLSFIGQIRPLKPLTPLNVVAGTNIHSLFVENGNIFCVDNTILKYGITLTQLLTGLANSVVSWDQVGNWIFFCNGTDRKAIYVPTPTATHWGAEVPTVAPTVAAGASGNPNGTYYCYYRFKVTLEDGTILRTDISPVGTVTVASQIIDWSGIPDISFPGAPGIEKELFRSSATMSSLYLVTTLAQGVSTYADDVSDASLVLGIAFSESEYWPPPDGISLVKYSPSADRLFVAKGGDVFWSEAGQYHIFLFDALTGFYRNTNSVFLAGEDITSISIIDENTYFGSVRTWRRLRGTNPANWYFEDTNAIAGPINAACVAKTPWGLLYIGIDGSIWMFDGFNSRKLFEDFVFPVTPTAATARGTFDGRFYNLFYDDPTNPEVVIDFVKYPTKPPRIVQSTRSAISSHIDSFTKELYISDGQYIRQGAQSGQSITTTFRTAEVNVEDLIKLGGMGSLIFKVNTQGDELLITPYYDSVAQPTLTAVVTDSLKYADPIPLPNGDARMMFFDVSITSTKDFILEDPVLIRKEE